MLVYKKKPALKAGFFALLLIWNLSVINAQELYVATEPASNMPTGSIGLRLGNEGMFNADFQTRFMPELMIGASKKLMLHASAYISDFYQPEQRFEGYSFYGKYRFFSVDEVKTHFRMAAFSRVSTVNNPLINEEISLEGDNSGLQGGLIITQLLHKLALSGSFSYTRAWDNLGNNPLPINGPDKSINYTLSGGYLVLPKIYKNYGQTNFNVYLEFLGKANPGFGQNYMDAAPAVQFIFNSNLRLDISQRFELWGNMKRTARNMYLLRLEYTFFNALSKNK